MPTDPNVWERLTVESRDALWKAAQLADAPVPLEVLTPVAADEGALEDAVRAGLATVTPHPLWEYAVTASANARGAIRAGGWTVGGHQLELQRDLVTRVVGLYYTYFSWPPPEMRQNAAELEPHLDQVAELARRLELWDELAQLLHRRALFVTWGGVELDRGLRYSREAVQAFRKTGQGEPHLGTLALLQTGLAYFLAETGDPAKAREVLLEAEDNVTRQIGSSAIEPFLVYCQLAQVSELAGDPDGAADAAEEARGIAKRIASSPEHRDVLLRQVDETMPWAHWFLQRYMGL